MSTKYSWNYADPNNIHEHSDETFFKKYLWTLNGQGISWLIHEHYLLEWFMNSSSHTYITLTWIVHEQFMWMWYLCGMSYSWTIPVNGAHELINNCPGPFNVHGHSLNSSWALLWAAYEKLMNTVHEQSRIFQRKFMNCSLASHRGCTRPCENVNTSLSCRYEDVRESCFKSLTYIEDKITCWCEPHNEQ